MAIYSQENSPAKRPDWMTRFLEGLYDTYLFGFLYGSPRKDGNFFFVTGQLQFVRATAAAERQLLVFRQ